MGIFATPLEYVIKFCCWSLCYAFYLYLCTVSPYCWIFCSAIILSIRRKC